MSATSPHRASSVDCLQGIFLTLLPRIERHARVHFRDVHCRDRREDLTQETIALAWRWFLRLIQRDKDPRRFPSIFASLAALAVRSGRRLCGQEKAKDALSSLAQQCHGFTLSSIPDGSTLSGSVFDEALRDNTQTPPEDQVAFRIDFPAWRASRCERDRRLIDDLLLGERTQDVAQRHGLTSGRVSQLRREFCDDWQTFCGEPTSAVV
jgi:hypothetical protein